MTNEDLERYKRMGAGALVDKFNELTRHKETLQKRVQESADNYHRALEEIRYLKDEVESINEFKRKANNFDKQIRKHINALQSIVDEHSIRNWE